MRVPLMRITVAKNSHWRSDPQPWKLYRPHRALNGQQEGSYATQQEAWAAAVRLAERDLAILLAHAGDGA